ncbi:MAG: hypothetical protein DI523_18805 [Paraburkholderia fungorum]|nr:MAG: hypothetical protein DI523_18805 [Paraburkholderia fungorum]
MVDSRGDVLRALPLTPIFQIGIVHMADTVVSCTLSVWQAEGKARHLIASTLVDRTELLGALPTTAREFC